MFVIKAYFTKIFGKNNFLDIWKVIYEAGFVPWNAYFVQLLPLVTRNVTLPLVDREFEHTELFIVNFNLILTYS